MAVCIGTCVRPAEPIETCTLWARVARCGRRTLKNIQIVDGADNAIFPIYAVANADFELIFPAKGQNIEFMQDLASRLGGDRAAGRVLIRVTRKRVEKSEVVGLHGTLFIDLPNRKKYFPNKREDDVYVP